MHLLLAAFFLETGVVLLLAPWSEFWDRNYFGTAMPSLHALMISDFVRGAVSGLGVVNLFGAIVEMQSFFVERRTSLPIVSLKQTSAVEE